MMTVTMSCDHRVVDGATGAKFLQTFKRSSRNRPRCCYERQFVRRHRRRRRPRRLCLRHPLRPAGPEDRRGRARPAGRHLPQLGLHPDQGAAALVRNLAPDAPAERVRLQRRQFQIRYRQDRGPQLAQGGAAAVQRRRLPDEEAQDHRDRRRGEACRARASSRSPRTARRPNTPPRTSCSPPARGRAPCRGWSRTES